MVTIPVNNNNNNNNDNDNKNFVKLKTARIHLTEQLDPLESINQGIAKQTLLGGKKSYRPAE